MYEEGILDPETFTQDTTQAQAKFYRGDSYVLNMNYQLFSDTLMVRCKWMAQNCIF